MNKTEWYSGTANVIRKTHFYNKVRKSLKELKSQGLCDKDAEVIHHLIDTEEQRKYNDEHYEMWGHNLDGSFEYGKYVIFCTRAEHIKIHAAAEPGKYSHEISAEAKKKLSERFKGERNPQYGKRGELATCYGRCGELHPMFGKVHTEETKNKIGVASKKYHTAYKLLHSVYKANGGTMGLNSFKHALKIGDITFELCPTTIYTYKETR